MADKAEKTAKATPEAKDERSEQKLKNALYSQAQRTLRERHQEEFTSIIEGLYSAEGLTYRRRLTEEEKAEKQMRDLLAKHPHLADTLQAPTPTEG